MSAVSHPRRKTELAPLWPETVTASRCPLSAAGVCPLEISHGRGGKAKDSSELFPESSGCKTGDSVKLQTPCHPSLISALSCIQHQVTGRAYMSTGAPQGGVWQCGREREHVPVTEGHVPLHLDGSGAREPRADTSLPDHSKHPNDAHPDLAGEAAPAGAPGVEQRAGMYDFFSELPRGSGKWAAVAAGGDWHPPGRKSVGRGPTRTQITAKVQPSVWRRGTLQCLVGLYPNIFSILLQKANIK